MAMIEKYYCSECCTHYAEIHVITAVAQIMYHVESDEIHCVSHLYCPDCEMALMIC